MADHIPFVNGKSDCKLVHKYYADSTVVRVCLERLEELTPMLPSGMKLWIDAGVDGLGEPCKSRTSKWKTHIARFPNYMQISDREFQRKPDMGKVDAFVCAVLDQCLRRKPAAISIPQLPLANDASRNKINRALADSAGRWRKKTAQRLRMILPAILTSPHQTASRTSRREKQKAILTCLKKGEGDYVWVADASLSDQQGLGTFRRRFASLVDFHSELVQELPEKVFVIAGPYWGMNLVLWARGLCRFPAVGVGATYQYRTAGAIPSAAKPLTRLALPPLRRWAQTGGTALERWLNAVVGKIDRSDPAYEEFDKIARNFSALTAAPETSRHQIASFYKQWCDEIGRVLPAGRALALYQMLSSAYVLGKTLPDLPPAERTARRPERIAEALMLTCL